MSHIREETMDGYRKRALNLADVNAVEEHLRTCAECRHRFLSENQVPAAAAMLREALLPEEGAPEHLDYEQMRTYIRGDESPIERLLVENHLAECPFCRKNLADMEQFTAELRAHPVRAYTPGQFSSSMPARATSSPLRWRLAVPLSATAALAFLIALAAFHRPAPGPAMVARGPVPPTTVPEPTRPAQPHPAPPAAMHRPVPKVRPAYRIEKPVRLPVPRRATRPAPAPIAEKPALQPALVAQLPKETSDIPAWARRDMERTQSTPPLYRSDAEPALPPIRLVSPDPGNASLLDARPTFTWQPVLNAASYTVRLETVPEDIDTPPQQVEAVTVNNPSFRPPKPLQAGRRYRLTVRTQPGSAATSTATPEEADGLETTWLFQVLSPDEEKQARWAQANATKHPVAAAMALYRLDRLADAAKIASTWHGTEQLRSWREALVREADRRSADPSE